MVKQLIHTAAILACMSTCLAEDYIRGVGRTDAVKLVDSGVPGMVYADWLADAVLWMPFPAEQLAGTYYDYSREGNDGAQATAGFRPLWTNGWGGAYNFDGGDDRINLGDKSTLEGMSAITLSSWVKLDTVGAIQTLIAKYRNNTNERSYMLWFNPAGSKFLLTLSDLGTNFYTYRLDGLTEVINTWYYIVATWNGTTAVSFYVNGTEYTATLDASSGAAISGALDSNTEPVYIGRAGANGGFPYYFNGIMDDHRIYNRVLSSNEQYNIYMQEPTVANGGKR